MIKTVLIYPKTWICQISSESVMEDVEVQKGVFEPQRVTKYSLNKEQMKDYPKEAIIEFEKLEKNNQLYYSNQYYQDLDFMLNKFFAENRILKEELIDIKYVVSSSSEGYVDKSALIIYEVKA